jgi:hypothetical protein
MRLIIDDAFARALNHQTPARFFGEHELSELKKALADCEPDPTVLPEWVRFVVQAWPGFSRVQTYSELAERLRQ